MRMKQTNFDGAVQYTRSFFKRITANAVPIVIATGSAGGTDIVIRSNARLSMISTGAYSRKAFKILSY